MSNVLKVSHQEATRSLYKKGWSQRRIARELGINRRTVRRYVEEESKCTSISKYLKPDLLIIDDMGAQDPAAKKRRNLLEIIMRRYENRSTLMTSNRPIEEWGKLLNDVPAASAILDRLLHHAEVLAITGRSYCLQDSANQRTLSRPKSSPQHQPAK
jgi:DNA replication protein DnaC